MFWRVCVWLLTAGIIAGAQTARKQISLIVTNGTVVTLDASRGTIPSGAIAIDGRDIVAVGTAEEIASKFTAAESIDATGNVVLPGLINTHTHAPMVPTAASPTISR
jgi:predicted amidohydrolase YtcJ